MRHGKAAFSAPDSDDFSRNLLPLGQKRTIRIARELMVKKAVPQLIISSPAARAHETALLVAGELGLGTEKVITNENLYFRSVNDYFDALYTAPEEVSVLMITGHNPLVTEFANFFLKQKIESLPTSGVVALQSDAVSWPEFVISYRKALFYLVPKQLEHEK